MPATSGNRGGVKTSAWMITFHTYRLFPGSPCQDVYCPALQGSIWIGVPFTDHVMELQFRGAMFGYNAHYLSLCLAAKRLKRIILDNCRSWT